MDHKRLSTGDVIDFGILERPYPKSNCPSSAVLSEVKDDWEWTEESLRQGLEAGGLTASMYYGCWKIWKDGDGFSGQLLQYRVTTESFARQPLAFALEKAEEWAEGCVG